RESISNVSSEAGLKWIPAFAGMTVLSAGMTVAARNDGSYFIRATLYSSWIPCLRAGRRILNSNCSYLLTQPDEGWFALPFFGAAVLIPKI
ncbi:MAG: hypothetical protein WAW86_07875, partial [Gammaproteobacteria bacterium]